MFKLAELFVDIKARDDGLKSQISGVKGQLTALGVAVGTAVGNLAASAIARAASALTGFFADGIKGAVNLDDSLSALGVIFGKSASVISDEADRMASKFGVVKGTFVDAASSFGASFKAIGAPADDAAKLGNQLAKLGMDMASFSSGTTNDQAFTALKAALRGEFDPLERFNVMLSAAAIETEALSLGLIKSAKEMDESAKKQATLSLILKKTTDQQGDLERTATSSRNAWSKLSGTMTNLATDIGTSLEPALNSLLATANEMATDLSDAFKKSKGAFKDFSDKVIEWSDTIGVAWRNLPDMWEIVQLKAKEMGMNVRAAVKALGDNLRIIGNWIANNWVNMLEDAFNAVEAISSNVVKNMVGAWKAFWEFLQTGEFNFNWTPLLDGFVAVTEELPEMVTPAWVSLQNEIDAIGARMADRENKRLEDLANKAKKTKDEAEAVAAAAGKAFKSESSGIADFAIKMRAAILGATAEGPAKKKRRSPLTKDERRAATVAANNRERLAKFNRGRLASQRLRDRPKAKQRALAEEFADVAVQALREMGELGAKAKPAGAGKDDMPKRALDEAKKTAEHTKRIAEILGGGIVAVLG